MPRPLDTSKIETDLRRLLRLNGPIGVHDAIGSLGISQPSFSRLVRGMTDVLKTGRARATRYALQRQLAGLDGPIPVYEISDQPGTRPRQLLRLHPVHPGFWVEALQAEVTEQFYDDLPWFLADMRPAGFLGRLVPRQLEDEGFPDDILRWSSDQTVRYLAGWGWNLPGNLILGDAAMERFVHNALTPPDQVRLEDVQRCYPELATDVLDYGVPGSSAAGEQPKFLATLADDAKLTPVMVKFSPPTASELGRRVADLLICEHIAHQVLQDHGQQSVSSRIVGSPQGEDQNESRVFLEVRRVDRIGVQHRRGLVSLLALDNEFVGALSGWRQTAAALLEQGVISAQTEQQIRWLAVFGELIGNTDMHLGNVSLHMTGTVPGELAPAYDMLPMLYAPRHNQLVDRDFEPPTPRPADANCWEQAHAAAADFWRRASSDPRISSGLRKLAESNAATVERLGRAALLLPQ